MVQPSQSKQKESCCEKSSIGEHCYCGCYGNNICCLCGINKETGKTDSYWEYLKGEENEIQEGC